MVKFGMPIVLEKLALKQNYY